MRMGHKTKSTKEKIYFADFQLIMGIAEKTKCTFYFNLIEFWFNFWRVLRPAVLVLV
jgi:hypothetical protein